MEPTQSGVGTGPLASLLEGTLDCVHCGLCLPACPTYRETGREISSPRGRIYLMRAVAEGRLPMGPVLAEEAHLCLGCRACETACPSGVRFGALLQETRGEVERARLRRGPGPWIERLALRAIVARPRRLHVTLALLAWAQRRGLDRRIAPWLPRRLRQAHALLPPIPVDRAPAPERVAAQGQRRGRVAFLSGCVMAELFAPVNRATLRVLSRNGFEVVVPRSQGCCGALHAYAGDLDFARDLVRRNVAAFGAAGADVLVTNSAGCGAALREAEAWLPGEAATLSASVRDVCEFLDEVGLEPPPGRLEQRVCYDDPCHLVHGQGVRNAPRRVLEAIPGLRLVSHEDPTGCCGAAGTYNLTHSQMSSAILERKLQALEAMRPDVVASGNPGCLMQLRRGVEARGLGAEVAHPIELLDRSYAAGSGAA